MRFSKPLYEKLPFIYFFTAVFVFFKFDVLASVISAALLFIVSAVIWVKRSDYRRQTRVSKTVDGIRLPQFIYEYYPFAFIAAALIILKYFPQPVFLALGLLLALVAIKNLIVRRQSRQVNPLKFGKNHRTS